MCIVRIREVKVDLTGEPTITVVLPKDYRTNFVSDAKGRRQIEEEKDLKWVAEQIAHILKEGKGNLATDDHPMRSFGSGILPRVTASSLGPDPVCVLHIRGSNRGSVWPLGVPIPDVLCWKEFAGVTGSPEELCNPKLTAIKELYEELSFVSNGQILLPSDLHIYPDTLEQMTVAIQRINKHYGIAFSPAYGYYPPIKPDDLRGDPRTTVLITDGKKENQFKAIVNYDPHTNSLEISFVAEIALLQTVTGILSLSGPENKDIEARPYLEDVVVVTEERLKKAEVGEHRLNVQHLLSAHGSLNVLRTRNQLLFYTPAPTLVPMVSSLGGTYTFRGVLKKVARGLEKSP